MPQITENVRRMAELRIGHKDSFVLESEDLPFMRCRKATEGRSDSGRSWTMWVLPINGAVCFADEEPHFEEGTLIEFFEETRGNGRDQRTSLRFEFA